jgi:hypothetical protein
MRKTIETMRAWAEEKNGTCLSDTYKNPTTKLTWRCSEGHEWHATPNSIQQGSWCPKCAGNTFKTIVDMRMIAQSRGGDCLSSEYKGNRIPLRWICKEGHEWEARPNNIKTGNWCRTCAGLERITLDDALAIAKLRGGECLSTVFLNSHTPMKWKCKEDHEWEATFSNVKSRGSWCPICSEGRGERITRTFFNQLFNGKFEKVRPSWLIGPKGHLLELDGYDENLKIAFEHHGKHHYEMIDFFHKNSDDFALRLSADQIKREMCRNNDVLLIEIPEVPTLTSIEDLRRIIAHKIEESGRSIPPDFFIKSIDLSSVYLNEKLADIQEKYGNKKGWLILSNGYLSNTTPLEWQCSFGHIFQMSALSAKSARKCPKCRQEEFWSCAEVLQKVTSLGGECLSEDDSNVILKFKCSMGHTWDAPRARIMSGSWCKICARANSIGNRKYTLETFVEKAKTHGGRCLSQFYKNDKDHVLEWECVNGHRWHAKGKTVLKGAWCKNCIRPAERATKFNYKDLQDYAMKREGICLSEDYNGYKELHLWRCKYGHEWQSTFANVVAGKWCKSCASSHSQDWKRLSIEKIRSAAAQRGGKWLGINGKLGLQT